jgi:hypothetical protein
MSWVPPSKGRIVYGRKRINNSQKTRNVALVNCPPALQAAPAVAYSNKCDILRLSGFNPYRKDRPKPRVFSVASLLIEL